MQLDMGECLHISLELIWLHGILLTVARNSSSDLRAVSCGALDLHTSSISNGVRWIRVTFSTSWMKESMIFHFDEEYGANLCHGKSILDGNCVSLFNRQKIGGLSFRGFTHLERSIGMAASKPRFRKLSKLGDVSREVTRDVEISIASSCKSPIRDENLR